MRTKLIATAAVMGLFGLVLAVEAGPSGAGPEPSNCLLRASDSGELEGARCATLEVTKVVTGTTAPDTTFPVVVDCVPINGGGEPMGEVDAAGNGLPVGEVAPFDKTLIFPAGGGTQTIVMKVRAVCTISETPQPGCTLVSINPPTVEVTDDIVYPVTVTNNCEVAAEAVAAVPTFTG